jgi:hypothetical protein
MSHLDAKARRQTMHGAPLWARAATVAAGPVFNFVLSFLVFAGILLFRGVASDPLTIDLVRPTPAAVQELLPGDELLAIDGRAIPGIDGLSEVLDAIPAQEVVDYSVRATGPRWSCRARIPIRRSPLASRPARRRWTSTCGPATSSCRSTASASTPSRSCATAWQSRTGASFCSRSGATARRWSSP